jgi:hypothetical protein
MALVSSISADVEAAHRKAARGGICVLIQSSDITRQSFDDLDTLQPPHVRNATARTGARAHDPGIASPLPMLEGAANT